MDINVKRTKKEGNDFRTVHSIVKEQLYNGFFPVAIEKKKTKLVVKFQRLGALNIKEEIYSQAAFAQTNSVWQEYEKKKEENGKSI